MNHLMQLAEVLRDIAEESSLSNSVQEHEDLSKGENMFELKLPSTVLLVISEWKGCAGIEVRGLGWCRKGDFRAHGAGQGATDPRSG